MRRILLTCGVLALAAIVAPIIGTSPPVMACDTCVAPTVATLVGTEGTIINVADSLVFYDSCGVKTGGITAAIDTWDFTAPARGTPSIMANTTGAQRVATYSDSAVTRPEPGRWMTMTLRDESYPGLWPSGGNAATPALLTFGTERPPLKPVAVKELNL